MSKRFIKIYEQIIDWEWFKKTDTLCLFLYLLVKANYKDTDLCGKTIKRGQIVTSLPKISTDTGLTIRQVRTSINRLKSTGELTDESSSQGRLITIIKYDMYQNATGNVTGKRQTNDRQNDRQTTDKTTDKTTACIEYIESIENNRNVEQYRNILPPVLKDDFIEKSFATFWTCYPKKRSKPDALRAWKKIKPDPALADEIMTGLQKWSESYDWMKDNGRYVPYPASWLNNRGWEDDIPSAKTPEPVKMEKKVIAQQYEQRDYSSVEAEIEAEQDREMEEFLRQRGGA